jgi:biopolymer transport protein TolR
MGMSAGGSKGVKSDINVTPLVDVVLVLLIIFMVVTPMLQRGKDVKLPVAKKSPEEKEKGADPVIISVTKDKKIYVEKDELADAAFEDKLREVFGKEPNKKILLKGDESLVFDDVRKVMNLARNAGAKSVSLGVEEQKE